MNLSLLVICFIVNLTWCLQQNGTAISSFVSQGLEKLDTLDDNLGHDIDTKTDEHDSLEELLKNCAGVAYSGAVYHIYFLDKGYITYDLFDLAGTDTVSTLSQFE